LHTKYINNRTFNQSLPFEAQFIIEYTLKSTDNGSLLSISQKGFAWMIRMLMNTYKDARQDGKTL